MSTGGVGGMAYDLAEPLVIGISSRALFDLERENEIFDRDGLEAYEEYQVRHEREVLRKGPAFPLAEAVLRLNRLQEKRLVEVIIMSRNSPNTSLRIFNSIEHYGLDIKRAALSGGGDIAPYLKSFKTDLFLSAHPGDVKQAVDHGVAAGIILTGSPSEVREKEIDQIRIAFDGDAVLFSAQAERIYQQEGLEAFDAHERELADTPLEKGPFANFLITLSHIQSLFPDSRRSPIRTALVTSRGAPSHERAVKTLRRWGVRVDEAFFLGGVGKQDVLESFGAHIFFDDQDAHTRPASRVVPSARVPYRENDDPRQGSAGDITEDEKEGGK